MGIEIHSTKFSAEDEENFLKNLRQETKILKSWFDQDKFESFDIPMCGLEVEAWLADKNYRPAPECEKFLNNVNNELIVPEIAKFNFELNIPPEKLEKRVFHKLHSNLSNLWSKCSSEAEKMGLKTFTIGSLPSVEQKTLTLDNMYPNKRYFALNERILNLRQNLPVILEIQGKESLRVIHYDVMLEAAATSMQIHLQVPMSRAKRFFNASTILSPLMIAVSANSPYLYSKCLWDESRVAIFEQAINLGSFRNQDGTIASRVSLGNSYVRKSVFEMFLENLQGYPVILPDKFDNEPSELSHLRLHNGTIWRWNRPLIGFNENNIPHIRIEHRAPSSGPSSQDIIANMVFYHGLIYYLANLEKPPEESLYFYQARNNFYEACQKGLEGNIKWIDGKVWKIKDLIKQELLGPVKESLAQIGIHKKDIKHFIDDIIEPRITSGQNGTSWQRQFVHNNGLNFEKLLDSYYQNQNADLPVHTWKV